MPYSIGEVAKKTGLTVSTLRYYEKEGLLPFVNRTENGLRNFTDNDLEWIKIIECLKITGMPIKDIKTFINWCIEGDSTIPERYKMFLDRKNTVIEQINRLKEVLDLINYKCWYYEVALKAGTTKIHEQNKVYEDLEPIPKKINNL